MAGRSEGEPADTDRFMVAKMENTLFTMDHTSLAKIMPLQCEACPTCMADANAAEIMQTQCEICSASMAKSDVHDLPASDALHPSSGLTSAWVPPGSA